MDDLDADFRVFYRFPADPTSRGIADGYFGNLSSARFFRLAERTLAFQGVTAARAQADKQAREDKKGPAPTTARSSRPADGEKRYVTLHQMMLLDPTLIQYEKG